jgi:two-component sensor histidine kinase
MWSVPSEREDGTARGLLLSIAAQLAPEPAEGHALLCALEAGVFERLRHPDGRVFERRSHPQLVDGVVSGHVISFRDVTAREAAQAVAEERARLLSEARHREELFHELNHRVKNNLQAIMAMIRLECGDVPDPTLQDKLPRILERIRAISMAHEQLSVTAASDVATTEFLERLARSVLATHGREASIRCVVEEKAPLALAPDELMTVGMLASELLVNAVRHGFPEGRKGRLGLVVDGAPARPRIVVEDDGVGLPALVDAGRSLGLRLVRSLAARLGADIDFEVPPGGGTHVVLTLASPSSRRLSASSPAA